MVLILKELIAEGDIRLVNFAMVEAYWNVGKIIVEKQGGEERVEYGKNYLKELSK